jgi:hypothetical protein
VHCDHVNMHDELDGERDGADELDQTPPAVAHEQPAAADRADSALATGAAFGVLGFEGGWIWRYRRSTQRGADAVSAATWQGTLHVCAWIAGLIALTVAGRVLAPGFGVGSFLIALVVMVAVAAWWDRRTPSP